MKKIKIAKYNNLMVGCSGNPTIDISSTLTPTMITNANKLNRTK